MSLGSHLTKDYPGAESMENHGSRAVVLTVAEAGAYTAPDRATLHDPISKSKSNKQKISMEQVKAMNHLFFFFFFFFFWGGRGG